jgi:hypothetical protein
MIMIISSIISSISGIIMSTHEILLVTGLPVSQLSNHTNELSTEHGLCVSSYPSIWQASDSHSYQ